MHPSTKASLRCLGAALSAVFTVSACGEGPARGLPTEGDVAFDARRMSASPGGLVSIPVSGSSARIWPFLTSDLETPDDPVNLVFTGRADPRSIRDALLGLSGSRGPTFPPVSPFDCIWSDAIGGLMAGYGREEGWGGTAVQLQCGQYGPIRFHVRLVKLGGFTLGNAHFEILIPGTTDHQVVSWELAEQLVAFDLVRSGLLSGSPAPTDPINGAPTHRAIPAPIYNGMPAELRTLIGGPAADVSADVGIVSDGRATVFHLQREAPSAARSSEQHLVLQFNQIIPKPFCASGPLDYLLVQGPVTLDQAVRRYPRDELRQSFHASGLLTALPIDVLTGQPSGTPLSAQVSEYQESRADRAGGSVKGSQHQILLPANAPGAGQLKIRIDVAPGHRPEFDRRVICQ